MLQSIVHIFEISCDLCVEKFYRRIAGLRKEPVKTVETQSKLQWWRDRIIKIKRYHLLIWLEFCRVIKVHQGITCPSAANEHAWYFTLSDCVFPWSSLILVIHAALTFGCEYWSWACAQLSHVILGTVWWLHRVPIKLQLTSKFRFLYIELHSTAMHCILAR